MRVRVTETNTTELRPAIAACSADYAWWQLYVQGILSWLDYCTRYQNDAAYKVKIDEAKLRSEGKLAITHVQRSVDRTWESKGGQKRVWQQLTLGDLKAETGRS